ncbi:MAG TPA: flagellar protein FliT [Candidatus Bathyarchaeia archaeon]|nr:flagellar protein FliT [Candidatus Bathyarchaeia archaeon]
MSAEVAVPATDVPDRLYGEILRVTGELCAHLRAGDDASAERLSGERQSLLGRIAWPAPVLRPAPGQSRHRGSRPESAAIIERILTLDRELLMLLAERKARVSRELTELGRGRRTLAAYRGPSAQTPHFLDRRQ